MKRRYLLLMTLIFTMCLTSGCGGQSSGSSAESAASAAASTAEENTADTTETNTASDKEEATSATEDSSANESAVSDTNVDTSASDSAESASIVTSTREMTDIVTGSMLPTSSDEYLTKEDISGLTPFQLRIARNEIFARHGRMFTDSTLSSYFSDKNWYKEQIDGAEFDAKAESILNEYEQANLLLIKEQESAVSGNYYASFEETWKMISSGTFSSMEYGDNTSEYCFYLYFDEAKDCGEYYEIPCEIERPAVFEDKLSVGESKTICCNDLTNESLELTAVSDDEMQGSNGASYAAWGGNLYDYYGSDDMIYFPCYVGTIRVEKDVLIGDMFQPETFNGSFDEYSDWFFNGVDFNSEGYATTLIYYGD